MFGFVKRSDNGADERLERRRLMRGVAKTGRESECVGSRQRGKTRACRFREFAGGSRRPRAQAHDAARKSEEVLNPVTHFPQQQVLPFPCFLEFGYVARDF